MASTTISQPGKAGPNSPGSDAYAAAVQDFYAALLSAMRYSLPAYDLWEPQVIGGKTGKYQLTGPFDTACEYRVLYLSATDATTAYIGKLTQFTAPGNATNIGGDPTISTPTPDPGTKGVVLAASANSTSPGPDDWLPFAANDQLVIDLAVASSHAAWVGILFRRRRGPSGVFAEGS